MNSKKLGVKYDTKKSPSVFQEMQQKLADHKHWDTLFWLGGKKDSAT